MLSGVPVPRSVENVYSDEERSGVLSDVMTSYHLIGFMNHHHTGLIRFRSYLDLLSETFIILKPGQDFSNFFLTDTSLPAYCWMIYLAIY